jgi:hypothetical protein
MFAVLSDSKCIECWECDRRLVLRDVVERLGLPDGAAHVR